MSRIPRCLLPLLLVFLMADLAAPTAASLRRESRGQMPIAQAAYDQEVKAQECVDNADDNTPNMYVPPGSHARGKHNLVIKSSAWAIYPNSGMNGDQHCDTGPGDGRTVKLDAEVRSRGKWRRATSVVTMVKDTWAGYDHKRLVLHVAPWAYKFLKRHKFPFMRLAMRVDAKDRDKELHKTHHFPADYIDVQFSGVAASAKTRSSRVRRTWESGRTPPALADSLQNYFAFQHPNYTNQPRRVRTDEFTVAGKLC